MRGLAGGYGSHFVILSFSKDFLKWPILISLNGCSKPKVTSF